MRLLSLILGWSLGSAGGLLAQSEKPSGLQSILPAGARAKKLASDMKFTEGPVWLPKKGILVFSDIPNSVLMQWSEKGGLKEYRKSERSNGNLLDLEGRLISCQHDGRNIVREEADGSLKVLLDRFESKRFNSPNDVAVKSDGTLWFTDPPWGLKNGTVGKELGGNWVYVLDPKSGKLNLLTKELERPNGIAFSPDEKVLYIADTHGLKKVRAFAVKQDNSIGREPLYLLDVRCDGMCVDRAGNIYTTSAGGIHVFNDEGKKLGVIPTNEQPANCAFGGEDYKTLFITARTSLYSVKLEIPGAKPPGAQW